MVNGIRNLQSTLGWSICRNVSHFNVCLVNRPKCPGQHSPKSDGQWSPKSPQKENTGPDLKVRGKNFDPKAPILVYIDGQEMRVEDLSYDGESGFSFRVPIPGSLGRHTILVTQKTNAGEISAAYAFNKTTSDNR